MASISSAGIGSGLDVNGLVTQLMNVEKQPLTELAQKEASYQAKLTAYGTLKGALSSVQSAARALKSTSLYAGMTASSSDSTVLTASASTAAKAGTYSMEVVTRAQAQSIASATMTSMTDALAVTAGKLKIEIGDFPGGTASQTTTIDIAPAGSSLNSIRDAINAANAGVRANIVYVGSDGYKLTLTSNTTGAAGGIRMTVLDSNDAVQTDNTGLAKLSYDPALTAGAGKEFTVSTEAQDAHIKIDGLDLYRSTNTVSDAITGVTLSLTKAGTSTLTVAKDTSSVSGTVQNFVKAYNDLNKQLRDSTAYNADTKTGSVLTGDSGAASLQSTLRQMINYRFSAGTGSVRTLSDLGVSMLRDGSLAFDSSKLNSVLNDGTTDMSTLFTSESTTSPGIAVRLTKTLDGLVATGGLLAARTDGLNRSISDIERQRETLARRLTQIEKRYRAQFTSLDSLVSSMQKTSSFLTQQLASLSSSSSSK